MNHRELKAHALQRVFTRPQGCSVQSIANELDISYHTLIGWMRDKHLKATILTNLPSEALSLKPKAPTPNTYSPEFKARVLRAVAEDSGQHSIKKIAEEFRVSYSTLKSWLRKLNHYETTATGSGQVSNNIQDMLGSRIVYSDDEREQVLNIAKAFPARPHAHIARELNINPVTVRRWLRDAEKVINNAPPASEALSGNPAAAKSGAATQPNTTNPSGERVNEPVIGELTQKITALENQVLALQHELALKNKALADLALRMIDRGEHLWVGIQSPHLK